MAKNKGFRRRDAAQKQRAIDTGITMHQLVGQVDLDALILVPTGKEMYAHSSMEKPQRSLRKWAIQRLSLTFLNLNRVCL